MSTPQNSLFIELDPPKVPKSPLGSPHFESESDGYEFDEDEEYHSSDDDDDGDHNGGNDPVIHHQDNGNHAANAVILHGDPDGPFIRPQIIHGTGLDRAYPMKNTTGALIAVFAIILTLSFSLYLSFPANYQIIPRNSIGNLRDFPYHFNFPIFSEEQHSLIYPSILNTIKSSLPNELISSVFWIPNGFVRIYPTISHNFYRFVQLFFHHRFNFFSIFFPSLLFTPNITSPPPKQLFFDQNNFNNVYEALFGEYLGEDIDFNGGNKLEKNNPKNHEKEAKKFKTSTLIISPQYDTNIVSPSAMGHLTYDEKHIIMADRDELLSQVILSQQQKQQNGKIKKTTTNNQKSKIDEKKSQKLTERYSLPITHTIRLDSSTPFSLYHDLLRVLNGNSIFPPFTTNLEELYITFLQNLYTIIQNSPSKNGRNGRNGRNDQNDRNDHNDQKFLPKRQNVKIIIILSNLSPSVYYTLRDIYTRDYIYKLSLQAHSISRTPPTPTTVPNTENFQFDQKQHPQITPLNVISRQRALAIDTTEALSQQVLPGVVLHDYIDYILLPKDQNFFLELRNTIESCQYGMTSDTHTSTSSCSSYQSFIGMGTSFLGRKTTFLNFKQNQIDLTVFSILTRLPETVISLEHVNALLEQLQYGIKTKSLRDTLGIRMVGNKKVLEIFDRKNSDDKKWSKFDQLFDKLNSWVSDRLSLFKGINDDSNDPRGVLQLITKLALFIENSSDLDLVLGLLQSEYYSSNLNSLVHDLFTIFSVMEMEGWDGGAIMGRGEFGGRVGQSEMNKTPYIVFHDALIHLTQLIFTSSLYTELEYESSAENVQQYGINGLFSLKFISQLLSPQNIPSFSASSTSQSPSLSLTLYNIQKVIDLVGNTAHIHGFIPFSSDSIICAKKTTTSTENVEINEFSEEMFKKCANLDQQFSQNIYLQNFPIYSSLYQHPAIAPTQKTRGNKYHSMRLLFTPHQANPLSTPCSANFECLITKLPFLFRTFAPSNPRVVPHHDDSNSASLWVFWKKILIPNSLQNNHYIEFSSLFHNLFSQNENDGLFSSFSGIISDILSLSMLGSPELPFSTPISSLPFKVLNGLTVDLNNLLNEPLAMEAGYSSALDMSKAMAKRRENGPIEGVDSDRNLNNDNNFLYQYEYDIASDNSIDKNLQYRTNLQLMSKGYVERSNIMAYLKSISPEILTQPHDLSQFFRSFSFSFLQKKDPNLIHNFFQDQNDTKQLEGLIATYQIDSIELISSLGLIPGALSKFSSIPLSAVDRQFYGEVQNVMNPWINNPTPTSTNTLILSHFFHNSQKKQQKMAKNNMVLFPQYALERTISKHALYFLQDQYSSIELTLRTYLDSWMFFLPNSISTIDHLNTYLAHNDANPDNITQYTITGILNGFRHGENNDQNNDQNHTLPLENLFTTSNSTTLYNIISTIPDVLSRIQSIDPLSRSDSPPSHHIFAQFCLTHYFDKKTPHISTILTSGLEHMKSIHAFMARNQILIHKLEYSVKKIQFGMKKIEQNDDKNNNDGKLLSYFSTLQNNELQKLKSQNKSLYQYVNNLTTTLTQLQLDYLYILTQRHRFIISSSILSPQQQQGFYSNQLHGSLPTPSILDKSFGTRFNNLIPQLSLPIVHQHLYLLSTFISFKGLTSSNFDHFQLTQKLALKCLFRSRRPSHYINPSTTITHQLELFDPQLLQLFPILHDHLGHSLPLSFPLQSPITTTRQSQMTHTPQQVQLVTRFPNLHASILSFYYQHHLGTPTDTFQVVHNFVTTSNSQSPFLCYLYNTMVSNMLHMGYTDKSEFHRYMDQTVHCWETYNRNPIGNSPIGSHFQPFQPLQKFIFEDIYPTFVFKKVFGFFFNFLTAYRSTSFSDSYIIANQLHQSFNSRSPSHPSLQSYFSRFFSFKSNYLNSPAGIAYGDLNINDILRLYPTLQSQNVYQKQFEGLIEFEGLLTFGSLHPQQQLPSRSINGKEVRNTHSNVNSVFFKSPQHRMEILNVVQNAIEHFDTNFGGNFGISDQLKLLNVLFPLLPVNQNGLTLTSGLDIDRPLQRIKELQLEHVDVLIGELLGVLFGGKEFENLELFAENVQNVLALNHTEPQWNKYSLEQQWVDLILELRALYGTRFREQNHVKVNRKLKNEL